MTRPTTMNSLKKRMAAGFTWAVLVLATLFTCFTAFTINAFKKNQFEFNENVTANYADILAAEIQTLEDYVKSTVGTNTWFARMCTPGISDFNWMNAYNGLDTAFKNKMSSVHTPAVLFFYDPTGINEIGLWPSDTYSLTSAEKANLYQALRNYLNGDKVYSGYFDASIGDQWLVYKHSYRGKSIGFFMNLNEYLGSTVTFDMPGHELVLLNDEGTILAENGDIESIDELQGLIEIEGTSLNGYRGIVTRRKTGEYPITIMLVGRSGRLLGLSRNPVFYLFLIGIPVVVATLFIILYRYMRKIMLLPISHLQEKIEQFQTNDIGEKRKGSSDKLTEDIEFSVMNDRLDAVVDEIAKLQEEKYQKELEVNVAQLQYLQLQVNPHFFLNCLNIISTLRRNGNEGTEQRFLDALVSHFRYVFNDKLSMVPLSAEIKEVRDYVDLYTIRKGTPVLLKIKTKDDCQDQKVPILVIQTFVENAIKYASNDKKILVIEIETYLTEVDEVKKLCIHIADNGEGYNVQVLQTMNTFGQFDYKSEHVGIENLKYRLHIIYQGRANIGFYNRREGGAAIVVYLPTDVEELL